MRSHLFHALRLTAAALLSALLVHGVSAAEPAPPATPDPIEGKWLGYGGNLDNRAVLGFDVRRDAQGKFTTLLYLDLLNYYGAPGPDLIAGEHGIYTVPDFGLTLSIVDDLLVGTLGPNKAPVELRRTDMFPADPPVPDLPQGPGPRWQVKLGSPIWAAAAVQDGVAYVGNADGLLNAVKVADGGIAWTFSAGEPIYGEALATEDSVFFVCDNGLLYRLERATGNVRWRYDLGDAMVRRLSLNAPDTDYDVHGPRPVLADGVVYVGSGDGAFHAVSADTGKVVWRIRSKGKIRTTAAIQGTNVIVATLDGLIAAVSRATGKEVWSKDTKAPVTTTPVVIGDRLIVGNRASVLAALDPATGDKVWGQSFWGSWVESTAAPFGDHFYIGSSDLRRVACYDPKDGRRLWRTDVFGWAWGRPAVTERSVFIGTGGVHPYSIRHVGGFCALDRATGDLRWRWPAPTIPGAMHSGFAASPALAGDTLVIGDVAGTLYAFPAE